MTGSTDFGRDPEAQKQAEDALLNSRMARIGQKIVVLSGKGGVGKSTVSAALAVALARAGNTVGLMDVDVHGPSIPRLLGLDGKTPDMDLGVMLPVPWSDTLKVMSLGFLLNDKYAATIWRGPAKAGVIRQFLQDVEWGALDYLVVDCPPGTGDEPLSVMQLLGPDAAAVIVTSPQAVAIDDVRRSVGFCTTLGNPVLGLVENMSGFTCPTCSTVSDVFGSGGGEALAAEVGIPFLGRIPLAQEVMASGEAGAALADLPPEHPVARALAHMVERTRLYSGGLALQNRPARPA
ncbi:MAG: ATP-binding protein [Deltaproteobacteria bacterium HGW-Deltaproteobacteria-8]|jgi:Mrp family chromosome partitioning ATPase|nr:MAG: ATP-binding protein [Deltaproteobacteria bacterium HGW-Deltaproteobacteria-8]